MDDILVPAAVWRQFLQSLHAKVTKDRDVAEMQADLEAFRARLVAHEAVFRAQLKAGLERKARAAEEKIERKMREAEEEIERKLRAADEELERKLRAAENEIARLRQLERLRQTAAIERSEWPQ